MTDGEASWAFPVGHHPVARVLTCSPRRAMRTRFHVFVCRQVRCPERRASESPWRDGVRTPSAIRDRTKPNDGDPIMFEEWRTTIPWLRSRGGHFLAFLRLLGRRAVALEPPQFPTEVAKA